MSTSNQPNPECLLTRCPGYLLLVGAVLRSRSCTSNNKDIRYIYMQMFQHALSGGNSDSNSRRNGNRTIEIMYNSNGGINEVQS
jgi:hypothetical protein